MNAKGQTSLEFLVLTVVIFLGAMALGQMALSSQDTTRALVLARSELMVQLHALESDFVILQITPSFPAESTLHLDVVVSPAGVMPADLDLAAIETHVAEQTAFGTVQITLSP